MWMRNSFTLALLMLSLTAVNAAGAYPEYRVTVVGPANSAATDINNAGVVVGTYRLGPTTIHGFLNRGKGLVDLGTLGGISSYAVAINDRGAVLGNWIATGGQQRGFIYYRGKQSDIGVIYGHSTKYTDINNAGYSTAIGSIPTPPNSTRSFLRAPDGKFTDIGILPFDNPVTHAYALNNRNQITGESGPWMSPEQPLRAFIWTKGVMRDLGDLGFDINAGLDINDRGQVTGFASLPYGYHVQHAFLYSHGRMIDIDARPVMDIGISAGTGINGCGHVVGTSDHLSGFVYRGRRMQSLNALIDPELGWDIRSPQAINDAGQIAATAMRKGLQYAVRLDLIRPSVEATPELAPDEDLSATAKSMSTAQGQSQAKEDADAQARELAQPVRQ